MYAELFAILSPLFVCAGLGFGWAKSGRDYDVGLVTALVFYLGTPCLIFSTLVKLAVTPALLGEMALAALLALPVMLATSAAALRLLKLPYAHFLPSLSQPNAGNMGLPVCLFAFGEPGLALAIAFFAVFSLHLFTVGQWIASGQMSPGQILRTPLIYAIAAAFLFIAGEVAPPRWLLNATDLIGGMTVPLMLITLGVSLAELKVANLRRSLLLAFLRLGIGLAVGFGLAALLGLEGLSRSVFILQCAMPVAVFNYLIAERFKTAPADVAGLVVVSALISFASLPVLLLVLL